MVTEITSTGLKAFCILGMPNHNIKPIAVIPNGINIPIYKKKIFRKKNSRNFLYLGRIHPIKGLESLIQSWIKMEKNNNCKL